MAHRSVSMVMIFSDLNSLIVDGYVDNLQNLAGFPNCENIVWLVAS